MTGQTRVEAKLCLRTYSSEASFLLENADSPGSSPHTQVLTCTQQEENLTCSSVEDKRSVHPPQTAASIRSQHRHRLLCQKQKPACLPALTPVSLKSAMDKNRQTLPFWTPLWSWTNWKIGIFFFNRIPEQGYFVCFKTLKKWRKRSRKTAGLIEVEFKSKRSAWAKGIEPLPWVPAPVERVAATSLLALCVQGVFSIIKLLPHFWKRSQQGETQLLPGRGRGWFWGLHTPVVEIAAPDVQIQAPCHPTPIRNRLEKPARAQSGHSPKFRPLKSSQKPPKEILPWKRWGIAEKETSESHVLFWSNSPCHRPNPKHEVS